MQEKRKKSKLKILGITIAVILILIAIVPLLIPTNGAAGLNEPFDLIEENGAIVTLPFEGTDGIDTYYVYEESKSETDRNFILIHGSLYNTNTWDYVVDYLSTHGNVYVYDQAPYGLSEKILEGDWEKKNPYTIDSAVVQLEAFMDVLNIDTATLIGSSFGGVIACESSLELSNRVDELILVDAAVFVNESVPTWLVELPQMDYLGPIFARLLTNGDSFYESTYTNKSKLTEERLKRTKVMTQVNNWDIAFWEYLKAWGTTPSNVSKKLHLIEQPTLVISGDNDAVVPLEHSEKLANSIKEATKNVIADCGHLPHEEKPQDFIEVLKNWFNR